MARQRVVIVGLARDLAWILPLTIRRLWRLGDMFADVRFVVFENDSTDDTRSILSRWSQADQRVILAHDQANAPVNPAKRCLARAARMAEYRHRCQQLVIDECGDFDSVIVADLDMVHGWSLHGIANTFGQPDWDFVGSNGLIYRRRGLQWHSLAHYDSWALRFDDDYTPLATSVVGKLAWSRGEPLVPVTSCFGGLGIYSMEAYATGTYDGLDCEHIGFHRTMANQGLKRLFLNPSQIVLHGRRHRSTDAYVRLAAGTHARAAALPEEPRFLFPQAPEPRPHVPMTRRAA